MPGAYSALPEPAPDPPDVPPGWIVSQPDYPGSGGPGGGSAPGVPGGVGNWPFPPPYVSGPNSPGTPDGPFPPGYEPDYSFNTIVPASIPIYDTISVSTQLVDTTVYTTGNPVGGSVITWSATINGSPRGIRIDGIGSYALSVDSQYTSVSGFWGAAPILDVDFESEDEYEYIELALISYLGGNYVSDYRSIYIKPDSYSIQILESVITSWSATAELKLQARLIKNGVPATVLPGDISNVTWEVYVDTNDLRGSGSVGISIDENGIILNQSFNVNINPGDRDIGGVQSYVRVTINGNEEYDTLSVLLPEKAYTAIITGSHNAPPGSYMSWKVLIQKTNLSLFDYGKAYYDKSSGIWSLTSDGDWSADGADAGASVDSTAIIVHANYYAYISWTPYSGGAGYQIVGRAEVSDSGFLIKSRDFLLTGPGGQSLYFTS